MTRWPLAVLFVGLLAYLLVSCNRLTVFPPVGQDEPWIAAAPYKLATQGVLGSDLFAGYYGMERHHYEHMPVFPLAQAGIFKMFGVGVMQMRALPVACGFLLLLAVFVVGQQAGGDRVGALAVILMLLLRVADGGDGTGIPLLDRARINRYDIGVPVFGLLALMAFNRGEHHRNGSAYALAGLLTGLSSLTHLYGVFWLPVFVGLVIARHRTDVHHARALSLLLAGFVLPWVPWAAYVATGWSDYLGQMRLDAVRFDVFNPTFYIDNVLHGAGPISLDWSVQAVRSLGFSRIGTWTMLVAVPAAWFTMVWHARRHRGQSLSVLAVASLAQLVMFVVLLKVKTVNYMIALWPLGAIILAWLGIWLWDRQPRVIRLALLVWLGLIGIEGTLRVAHARDNATQTMPYDWYEAEVARCIPSGSMVLGLQHYWLGLRQYPYRTWLLPVDMAHPLYQQEAMSFDEALERVNPTVILVDRYIDDLMKQAADTANPNHRLYLGFEAFKARRKPELACVIRDHTYGTMQVYRLPPRTDGRHPSR